MMVDVAHEDPVTRTGREIRPSRLSFDHGDVVESRPIRGLSNFCEARRLKVSAVDAAAPANVRRDANGKRSRTRSDVCDNRSLVQVQNLDEPRDICRVVRSLCIKRDDVAVDGEGQSRNATFAMFGMSHCDCDLTPTGCRLYLTITLGCLTASCFSQRSTKDESVSHTAVLSTRMPDGKDGRRTT